MHKLSNYGNVEIVREKVETLELEYKEFSVKVSDVKQDGDKGKATILLSPYNNIDDGNDRVLPSIGKINDKKKIPLLKQHTMGTEHGHLFLIDTPQGIKADETLYLEKTEEGVPIFPEAYRHYALLKRAETDGIPVKYSIGYQVLPKGYDYTTVDGQPVRDLKLINIMEGSRVTFPMNPLAQNVPGSVKSQNINNDKNKDDKKVEIKVDNSKNSASSTVKWGDLDETPIKQAIQKASNSQALADEACLTLDKGWETNVSKMNYLHHILKDGVLVVDNIGVQAARQRAAQQGIISGTVEAHLKKHYKELGLKWDSKKEGENALETKDQNNLEEKAMGFADLLKVQQANDMRWKLQDALNASFRELMNDDTMTADDKVTQLGANVDDFATAYKQAMSILLKASAKNKTAKKQVQDELEKKSLEIETKTGKKISKANKKKIQNCKDILDDLIASLEDNPDEDSEDNTEDDEGKSKKTPVDDTQNNTDKQKKVTNGTLELKSEDIETLENINNLFKEGEE